MPNPNWPLGYVPTQTEWNAEFAACANAAGWSINSLFVSNASGVLIAVPASAVISVSGLGLVASPGGGGFGFKTSVGALSANLPPLASTPVGWSIRTYDASNRAGVNNYTINSFGSDAILSFDSSATSHPVVTSNLITEFFADPDGWRVFVYGGAYG